MSAPDAETAAILCGLMEAMCGCELPAQHEGPHVCACGGSWYFDEVGDFVVVTWPMAGFAGGDLCID